MYTLQAIYAGGGGGVTSMKHDQWNVAESVDILY